MDYGDLRCDRCHRPYQGQADWTFTMKGGQLVEVICAMCRALGQASGNPARQQ